MLCLYRKKGGLMQKGKNKDVEEYKTRLLSVLTKHIGKSRSIGMAELYEQVFGKPCSNKINEARFLRKLITELRKDGVPVCSDTDREGGGYYLASAGSELENYCMRLRIRALKILKMEATLRKKTLPELLGQITMSVQ